MKNSDLKIQNSELNRLPHIEQYAGAWAMQPEVLDALAQRVRGMDIAAHVANTRAGFADGLEMSTDAPLTITSDGVAILEITGTLTKYGSSLSSGPAMVAVQKQVRDLKKDNKVQGVMVQIDSGGGTVAGTEDLAAELRALAEVKPAMARIVDTGASGALWLALAMPVISANVTAVIGSIGVMGVMYDTSAQAAKQGVEVILFKAGEFKGTGTPGVAISDKQRAQIQRVVDEQYAIFVDTVARGRGISRDKALALADGRVHVGENARKLGLVDAIEGNDAAYARMLAMIKAPRAQISNIKSQIPGATTGGTRVSAAMAHISKEVLMEPTQVTAPGATAAQVTAAPPVAATAAELKSAFPKASADFREKCQLGNMTLAQAQAAYSGELEQQLAQKTEELTTERAKGTQIGARAITEKGGKGPVADTGDFNQLVADKMAAKPNLSRRDVIKMVAKENPEAHRAYVAASPIAQKQYRPATAPA